MGKPGPKPGQPQLTLWAAGILPGLHYTTAGNVPLMLTRGVIPGCRILVRSFRRLAAPSGRAGPGVGQKSAVPTADPLTRTPPLAETRHGNSKSLTRTSSTRSPCLDHLTRSTPCYSGPVRAPAFRERQTGAPRPGTKSSPWPPSVSRSTDRVTQDNGIDPKPFWRLRAIPKEPHLIKPYPSRPRGPW